MGISDLPYEILCQTFEDGCLSQSGFNHMTQVSRFFSCILSDRVFNNVHLVWGNEVQLDKLVSQILASARLRNYVVGLKFRARTRLTDVWYTSCKFGCLFLMILRKLPQLKFLHIQGTYLIWLPNPTEYVRLESLESLCLGHRVSPSDIRHFLFLPRLKSLDIHNLCLQDWLPLPANENLSGFTNGSISATRRFSFAVTSQLCYPTDPSLIGLFNIPHQIDELHIDFSASFAMFAPVDFIPLLSCFSHSLRSLHLDVLKRHVYSPKAWVEAMRILSIEHCRRYDLDLDFWHRLKALTISRSLLESTKDHTPVEKVTSLVKVVNCL